MQRENLRRGFSIYRSLTRVSVYTSHQSVVLEIDFSGSVWGYTEITIIPTSKDLKTIHLHSRQCTIHSVTVASHRADFIHYDPLANINVSNPQDVHNHPELKRRVYSALAEGEEGELSIAIPQEVSLKQSGSSTAGLIASEAATPEPQTPGASTSQIVVPDFAPITIKIEYSIRNPVEGLNFVLPSDAHPYRVPHVFTTPSSPDAARCWVPCIDNPWERCTWDFEFVVPRFLEERDIGRRGEEDEDEQGEYPTLVVCSGELVEQVAHPFNSNKSIFVFSQTFPTSVQHIGFAAGPFHVLSIPAGDVAGDDSSSSSQPLMHAFCLPGHEPLLAVSVLFLRQAMTFYSTEFGSYPFGSHKLVFVDELPTLRFDTATLSILTVDLLHGDDAIDQVYETRQTLSHALACQWIGINIQPKVWSDLWLVNGLGLYITGLFLRKLFGNNEYRFRLKKDMERVVDLDSGSMPPICQPMLQDPPDSAVLSFINLKSPLALHILDRRLGKSGTSLGLSRVLPKLFLSAISGEMMNNALSTHAFLRTCRKVSGVDLRSFAEQWIYGSGCPAFGFSASFNRKKMAVEITMRQDAPAWKAHEHDEIRKTMLKPVAFFEGQMTIRIHEADGTPYEHVLDIRSSFKRYEVPFNTKYKRVRRNTKRYLARQAAAQAAAEGDAEAAEAMGMVDMGFGLDIWEKEKERDNWKVADWTEEDEQTMNGATYEWIRMDADFEWIAAIAFDQPDFMWVSQLQRDRDVIAQLEAVNALSRMPSAIISSTLTKTVLVSNYFFRVRCEAALALVTCAYRKLDFLGLFHLFKLFLRYCYEPEDAQQDLFAHSYVPRPNDFSDYPEYFVRRALIRAVASVRFENGKCPAVVRQFLIDQLKYNDNTANPYTDAFYICTLVSALACASVSTLPPERGELFPTETTNEQSSEEANLLKESLAEVDRYRSMDRLIPSPHNVVTIAALEFRLILSVSGLIPNDPRVFFPLTREGNYTQVRIAAFDALFLTKWYTPKIMRYILAVAAHDSSRVIRRHVARNACQSLALLVTMGELKGSGKETDPLLIEEDGVTQEKVKENKKSEVDLLIKALRKDKEVGKNEIVREFLLPVALAPDADQDVRWSILKLADILIRGAEEAPPKLSIHLPPPTPIVETPSALPPLKVGPAKPPRAAKAGSAVASRPTLPPPAPPKIRLLPSGTSTEPNIVKLLPTPTMEPPMATPNKKGVAFRTSTKSKIKDKGSAPTKIKEPKGRSGGMTSLDFTVAQLLLRKLTSNKRATIFLQPVDPVRDHAPNYFDVIRSPMDLSNMSAKLQNGVYKDRFALEADFRLMIRNAKTYNLPESYAYNEAAALETFFEKEWARSNNTLQSRVQKQIQPVEKARPAATAPAGAGPSTVVAQVPKAAVEPAPRPSIKLKFGGPTAPRSTETPVKETPANAAPSTAKAPKIRKPKPDEAPLPPVEDDGSLDILEEVLAMEAMHKKHHRTTESVVQPGKRKKGYESDLLEDDEILALASPSKKPSKSPQPPVVEKEKKAAPTPRASSIKIKRPVPLGSLEANPATLPLPVPPDSHRASNKGKEREVVPSSASPAAPPRPSKKASEVTSTPINKTKVKDLLKTLLKMPEAVIFARPVDPVLDGCPTYFDEIKQPMDLGTITTNVTTGKYTTNEEVGKDIELVFANCRLFNPPTTYPVECADAVERAYKKEWTKVMERKMSWTEKRSVQTLMNNLVKDPISYVFREPVDPVALGIPQYFEIIPRKDARDLQTIRQKLDADKYESMDAWEADIDLMINNAIIFNSLESEVGQVAVMLGNRVKEMKGQQGMKKRKEGSEKPNGGQPVAKKAKLA
ncbi:hypothetical protein FA95DRAFT_1538598 [Auriscalpium vulgare]|uniref:Uncharacterized protein n=1 Tax=Auriscalpium vulgare TaxID=40419 RepID=A0ACB8RYE4_9AGAM|nr:hypothetical protein FA95DRAFT_1538598 [Auriscalpium vulgare]